MDNNNFTQNNFNQLNNGDSYNNQQPTNPGAEQPQVFSQPVPQQPIIPQQPNVQPQTMQQPPIVSQQPAMQPQIMQQPIIQPTATELQTAPVKKSKIGLFIGLGILVIVVIVSAFIFVPKILTNTTSGDDKTTSNEKKEQITSIGKIPYNKETNSCAINNVEYKDNTRNLCDNESYWFNSKTQKLVYGHIDYTNISFYLNTDESDIVSYTRPTGDTYGYKFLSAFKDDTGNHYVYLFYEMERGNYIYVTSASTTKILSKVDFTNFTQKELSDGKKLDVPNVTASGYYGSTYRMNKKYNDLEVSIIHLGESNAEEAYTSLKYFSNLLSLDNGAPFLFDLVITKEKVIDYNLKSYKYVTKLSTESNIRGERYTDLHISVTNNNIYYEYADTYSYMPDFFTKYEVYLTKALSNNKSVHGTYIPEDNEFMVVTELIDKYYVSNADFNLGAEYYINKFTEMFISSDGQGFMPVEKYSS